MFLLYLVLSLWCGKKWVEQLRFKSLPIATQAILGFLLLEGVSFFSFVGIHQLGFYPRFGINFWVLIAAIAGTSFFVLKKTSFRFQLPQKKYYSAALLAIILVLSFIIETAEQWQAVATGTGVIYQDIIYHAGISNALLENGFPVVDYQYAGRYLSYHFFTHFICAKWSYLLEWRTELVYIIIFPLLSLLIFSSLLVEFVRKVLPADQLSTTQEVLIGILAFYSYLLLGGYYGLAPFSFYFSYSYQFQLIILLIFGQLIQFYFVEQVKKAPSSFSPVFYFSTLLFLFIISIVVKGSSLPILLAGFGLFCLSQWLLERQFPLQWVSFTSIATLFGALTYVFFFTNSDNPDFLSFFGYNSEELTGFTSWHILEKILPVDHWQDFIFAPLLLVSILSFRVVLIRFWRQPLVSWASGMLLAGSFFALFFTNNAVYFLMPALFMASTLALIFFIKTYQQFPQVIAFILVGLIACSTYPLASKGLKISTKLARYSETFFPMSHDRLALYQTIKNESAKDAIIFTPTVTATAEGSADNYAPAAFAKRSFLLGGYRFGGLIYTQDFANRLELVNNFSLSSSISFNQLKNYQVTHVLIENQGLRSALENELAAWLSTGLLIKNKAVTIDIASINKRYELVLKNDAGVVLKLLNSD